MGDSLNMETNILFGGQSVLMEDIVSNGIADIKEEIIIPDNLDDYLENNKKIDSYESFKNESNHSKFINKVSNFTPSPRIWVKDKIKLVERTGLTEVPCKLSSSQNEKQKILPANNEGFCQPMSISQLEANDIYSEENLSVRKSESVRKYMPRIKKKVLLPIEGEKVQGNENQTKLSLTPETQEIKKEILSPVDEQSKNKEPHLTENSDIHKWEKAILPIEETKKELDRNEVLHIGMDEEQLDRNEMLHIDTDNKQVNKYNNKSMCIKNKITQESKKEIVNIDNRLSCDGKTYVIQIDLIDTSNDESDESLTEFSPTLITNNDSKTINSMINQQCYKCGTVGESIDIAKGGKFCKVCEKKLMHRCKICGQIFPFANSIIQHIIKNHPKKLVKARSQLQIEESQNVNLEEFICQECGLTFLTKEQMTLHIFESKTGLEFSCTLCPKKEINRCKLRHHIISSHKGEYKADSLNDIIADVDSTEDKHIAMRIPNYYMNVYCTNCDEIPCIKRRHKALCLNCGQPYILECGECYEVHPSDNSLRNHVIRHHLRKKYYNCTTCPRVFRHRYELQAHQSRCSDEKEYICPDCPAFCTTRKQAYLLHMRSHRQKTTTNKVTCKYCCKLFATNATLSTHWRLHCRKNKRLKCGDCGWVGVSKKGMAFHLQRNHGKEVRDEEMIKKRELEKIIKMEEEKTRIEEIIVEVKDEKRTIEEIIEMKGEKRGVKEIIMEIEEEKSGDEEITEGNEEKEVKVRHRQRKRRRAFTRPRNKKSKH